MRIGNPGSAAPLSRNQIVIFGSDVAVGQGFSGRCTAQAGAPTHLRLFYSTGNIGNGRWQSYGMRG